MGTCRSGPLTLACLLSWVVVSLASAQTPPVGTFDPRILLGPDGEELPFANLDELLRFLVSAEETSVKILERGITGAERLTLEQGGLKARAVFHDIDRKEQGPRPLPNGRTVMYLRDSYSSQAAAYRLSSLLGMQNVPPTVLRVSGAAPGSAQLWIEKAMTEDIRLSEGLEPPDHNLRNQSLADMRIFDNLINNIDRNQSNMLVDSFGNLWLIDHTRSFGQDKVLPLPEMIIRCSNSMLQAIRSLNEETVRKELAPLLSRVEIKALWHRRARLLERIEQQLASKGPESVLFDYGDPDPGVSVQQE